MANKVFYQVKVSTDGIKWTNLGRRFSSIDRAFDSKSWQRAVDCWLYHDVVEVVVWSDK